MIRCGHLILNHTNFMANGTTRSDRERKSQISEVVQVILRWILTDVKRLKGDPRFELRSHLYRVFGVDLTQIPGVNVLTAQTLLAEIGPDLSRFASAPTFTS